VVIAPSIRKSVSRSDYDSLRIRLAESNSRVTSLTIEVGRLSELVAKGNERIAELFAVAQRKTRKSNKGAGETTEQPPAPPEALDDAAKEAFQTRPLPPKIPKKKKRKKKKQRPTGRKPLPDHLEAEKHTKEPDVCDCCGSGNLEFVGKIVETKLHVVKEHMRKRVVERITACCCDCGERTTARSLPSPFARSKATCEWLAWLIHQKFVMLTPLDRLRRDLASRGIPLAMSYLVMQVERAADLLAIVDGEHWKQLCAGDWMATDATGLKVLIPGLFGTHNGHLEVYRRCDLVVFQYEAEKGSETLVSKLAGFSGVLVADAEHRHNAVFANGNIVEAGCNAHGRRRFRDAETVQPVLAKEGGTFIAAIYITEAEAQKRGFVGDKLIKWRQQNVPPLMARLKSWMDSVEPTLIPSDSLATTIRYYRNHWSALFRFVDHPEIPIDNSASEREFQQVAKIRLNSLFAGSTEGAHRAAILLGIVATCRALAVDPLAYLGWAFTRLGTHRDVYGLSAADLTPAAYAKAILPKT
jgi:transposase